MGSVHSACVYSVCTCDGIIFKKMCLGMHVRYGVPFNHRALLTLEVAGIDPIAPIAHAIS